MLKLFFITFSSILVPVSFALASNVNGTLMVVKGDVNIESTKDKKTTKARIGSKVFQGDMIVTGKDSRAKLVMLDKNVININPDTSFKIEQYAYSPEKNEKGAVLNVIYGKVRTTVNQKYDGEKNKFLIKTKSSVAGVRGTDFVVQFSRETGQTRVVTFEGRVEVGAGLDASGRIANAVVVDPGQFTTVAVNTPPAQPTEMPAQELQALNAQSNTDTAPAVAPSSDDTRQPSSSQDGKKQEDGSGGGPNAVGPGVVAGALMNEMGETVAMPDSNDTRLPATFLPPPIPNFCPPGGCGGPLITVDPSLLQGNTNVIIQLVPVQ